MYGRRERRFEAGFGHSKLDQLDQRPPAATDPPAVPVWTRQPLWQQSGPSPTMRTRVPSFSVISI